VSPCSRLSDIWHRSCERLRRCARFGRQVDARLNLKQTQQDGLGVVHAGADALEAGNTAVLKVGYKENRH
jgi:hypothetical protein